MCSWIEARPGDTWRTLVLSGPNLACWLPSLYLKPAAARGSTADRDAAGCRRISWRVGHLVGHLDKSGLDASF